MTQGSRFRSDGTGVGRMALAGRWMGRWLLKSSRVLQVLVIGIVAGVVGSIVASVVFLRFFQDPLSTLTIPVLITGQDNQGGQFALGVSRAADWAERFRLDELNGRRVRPLFLDEDRLSCPPDPQAACNETDNLAKLLKDIDNISGDVPIVVGPLTSTHALAVVPAIAQERRIPMVLGIPTNVALSKHFGKRVWRLSPTDEFQAKTVAKTLERLAQNGENSMIVIDDSGDNSEYSHPLATAIARLSSESGMPTKPQRFALDGTNLGEFEQQLKSLARAGVEPKIFVYVGMPEQAKLMLSTLATEIGNTFVFTDGCIDLEFLDLVKDYAEYKPSNRFFFTFQAPPPSQSKGIRSYIWFTQSMGGHVTGLVDRTCGIRSAATSYEVFGFDSYMIALNLLRDGKKGDAESVAGAMRLARSPQWPFLLMPYEFDDAGNNKALNFHVYEVRGDGCPFHSGGEDNGNHWCPNDT